MEKYILVVGDSNSGKTSLIQSITSDKKPLRRQQRSVEAIVPEQERLAPVQFSLEYGGKTYTVHFIDTTNSWDTIQEHKHFILSDLVLFVIESGCEDSFVNFQNNWLPIIQQAKKPLFLVRSKVDLNENYQCLDLLESYERFVGSTEYSIMKTQGREHLIYEIFNYLFLNPTSVLYDYDKRELRPLAISALNRVFWLLDKDHDKKLKAKEFAKYTKLAQIQYTQQEFNEALNSSNVDVTLDKFIQFQQFLINARNVNAVWNVLHAFDFNSALIVEDRHLIKKSIPKSSIEDLIVLADASYVELSRFFKIFDSDNDGLLSREEIDRAFDLCFDFENPFARMKADYLSMVPTEDGKLTMDGWLALWSLATLQNPYSILKCLIRWGETDHLNQYLTIKKKRKFRKTREDYPKIINAYIFGATRCGKSSIMQNLIGINANNGVYNRTMLQNSVVNVVEEEKGGQYYLAITEFEDKQVLSMLESEHIMDKCDVAVMVFDGSDPHSFSYLAKLQQKLDPTIPCAYVLNKFDLEPVDQFHDVPPNEFCEELKLPWPPIYHSAVDYDNEKHQTFDDILYFALNPDTACPIWNEVDTDSDTEVEQQVVIAPTKKSSLLSRTMKLFGVLSLITIGSALLWKFVAKPKQSMRELSDE
jgi:Ras family protein T1